MMRGTLLHIATSFSICFFSAQTGWTQERKCIYSEEFSINLASRSVNDWDRKLNIPVLVHIVFRNESQNISLNQIHSQLRVINEDFQRSNSDVSDVLIDFEPLVADVNINFVLHTPDNIKLSEVGVVRASTNHSPFLNSDLHYSMEGGSDAVSPTSILNIWVADLGGDLFAYSKNPPHFPQSETGIVIDYEYFGTNGTVKEPFDKGRTLTHEIGHWLGLPHPWGSNCIDADNISDTPVQKGPAYDCELERSSCQSRDMVQNFMNLSNDRCLIFFTEGQRTAMRNFLMNEKGELINNNLILDNQDYEKISEIMLFPNPAHEAFAIKASIPLDHIEMRSTSGKEVGFDLKKNQSEVWLLPKHNTAGIYFLTVSSGDRKIIKRVILNK